MQIFRLTILIALLLTLGCDKLPTTLQSERSPEQKSPHSFELPASGYDSKPCSSLSPFCKWTESTDYRYEILTPNHIEDSSRGVGSIFALHDSGWPSYELSFNKLWQTMGIENFIDKPNLDVCGPRGFQVNRDTAYSDDKCVISDANLSWEGSAFFVKSNSANAPFLIEIPSKMRGKIRVTGGFVTIVFEPGYSPKLSISPSLGGPTVWNDEIACLTMSTTHTIIRGRLPMDAEHPVIIFK